MRVRGGVLVGEGEECEEGDVRVRGGVLVSGGAVVCVRVRRGYGRGVS